jgi:HD-GYP domain-containing protein (c-di-GMP phosphodiesterase class II)
MREITQNELEVGKPLPWDVYGDGGGLLARKGYEISSMKQIENLLKRGRVAKDEAVRTAFEEPPSVLRMLNLTNRRLQLVLAEISLGRATNTRLKLDDIARSVMAAVDLHADVALACILHNQQAGPYCVRHSLDTAIVSLLLARAMKLPPDQLMLAVLGALTMNVGMLEHQERLQHTQNPLSTDDCGLIRQHPQIGADMLRRAGIEDQGLIDCVLMHHENENGTGYPGKLKGDEIPMVAKIVSLADRYCARVSSRSYRKPMLPNAALRDILLEGKSTVSSQLAAVFIQELGCYPIGTLVRLLNGEIGVVTRKGLNTTTPIVDALVGPRGAPLEVLIRRDTKNDNHAIREVLNEAQASIMVKLDQLWGRVAAA